eukprot:SAG31_NODE_4905_length_2875_cov_2.277017_6_plen_219_part_00
MPKQVERRNQDTQQMTSRQRYRKEVGRQRRLRSPSRGQGPNQAPTLPPRADVAETLAEALAKAVGAFLSILLLSYADDRAAGSGYRLYAGPMAAPAAIVFGGGPTMPKLRNVVVATVGSTLLSVIAVDHLPMPTDGGAFRRAACVGFATLWMVLPSVGIFPPAAALAASYSDAAEKTGFWFVMFPSVAGCVLIVVFGHLYFGFCKWCGLFAEDKKKSG